MGKDMKLTGKSSSVFNMYLLEKVLPELKGGNFDIDFVDFANDFHDLPESMQWGVLVDFFESELILVNAWDSSDTPKESICYGEVQDIGDVNGEDVWILRYEEDFPSMYEARSAAIKKANELLNNKLEEMNK